MRPFARANYPLDVPPPGYVMQIFALKERKKVQKERREPPHDKKRERMRDREQMHVVFSLFFICNVGSSFTLTFTCIYTFSFKFLLSILASSGARFLAGPLPATKHQKAAGCVRQSGGLGSKSGKRPRALCD